MTLNYIATRSHGLQSSAVFDDSGEERLWDVTTMLRMARVYEKTVRSAKDLKNARNAKERAHQRQLRLMADTRFAEGMQIGKALLIMNVPGISKKTQPAAAYFIEQYKRAQQRRAISAATVIDYGAPAPKTRYGGRSLTL